MGQVYLAIDYGGDGWVMREYNSPEEALQVIKDGGNYGSKWKILEEIEVEIVTQRIKIEVKEQ